MKKIYLAGPDVFAKNADELGEFKKWICKHHELKGLYPLDNKITETEKHLAAQAIVKGNLKLIQISDFIIANLNNFRGTDIHPSCDSGTAFECGYGLQMGKIVIGYTNDIQSIPEEMQRNLHLITPSFLDAIEIIHKVVYRKITLPKYNQKKGMLTLEAPFSDIKDANAEAAFKIGALVAMGFKPKVNIPYKNLSQIQKYGKVDENGYNVEDFDYPVNIMLAVTTKW